MKRVLTLGAVTALSTAVLTGCGGDLTGFVVQGNMTPLYIQTAVTAVVTDAKIPIAIAPVCEEGSNKTSYSCTGKAANGQPITASVPYATASSTNAILQVKVGNKVLYNGGIDKVLLKQAQVQP